MRYSLALFVVVWCCVFSALRLLPELTVTRTLVTLGSLLLAGIIADLLVKLAVDLLPRRLVPDLRNKAVLVTGCRSGFGLAIAKRLHGLGVTVYAGLRNQLYQNAYRQLVYECYACAGCSSGFGLATAKRLDALGVTVYAGLRNPQCPGAVELKETCSQNMHVIVLDVTKDKDVQHAVDYVRNTIGDKKRQYCVALTVFWAVVNNAGLAVGSPVEWTPDSDYQLMWNTNAMGCVRVTKAFLPLLRLSGGRVVIVNSLGGMCVTPLSAAYSMTKFALNGFAEGLRRELTTYGVSVHSIHPYFYKTKIMDSRQQLQNIDKNWENLSSGVRDSYGKEYLMKFKKSIETLDVDHSLESIDSPVDDTIDAAMGATPKMCYVPDWKPKLFFWCIKHLPASFVDLCIRYRINQA